MIIYPVRASKGGLGGKAAGLLKLKRAGVAVPDFLVVPAVNFDAIIKGGDGDPEIIRNKLSCYTLKESDRERIKDILATWDFPRNAVVVRSSIADEDGSRHAFAGLMASFVNLTKLDDVYACVAACAASAYSAIATGYRKQNGLQAKPRTGVIIQQQIDAAVSGVVFSTFPEYPREMAIHAVWGFGEGLVSGRFQPDEFYLQKENGKPTRIKIADKQHEMVATAPKGTIEKEVEAARRGVACLSDKELAQLYSIAAELEERFGHPQDIEFVIRDQKVWVVQSRPVTQPIPEVLVYDNSNIQESYCGVTTPLTFSFARRAYATVYKQTMRVLALPEKKVQAHEQVVNNLLHLLKGRIYYNINHWYKGLLLLPSFKQNKEDMERMMGLQEPVHFIAGTSKTIWEKLTLLPSLAVNLVRLLLAFNELPKTVPAFHLHFTRCYNRFYTLRPEELTGAELLAQKDILDRELLHHWTTPIINDFYVMMTNGRVVRRLKKVGIPDVQAFLSVYLSGDQEIESVQPVLALQKLAEKANANSALRKLILELPPEVHHTVKQLSPAFYNDVTNFMHRYGDRTVGELKLETTTMRIGPVIFYKYLGNYLHGSPTILNAKPALRKDAVKELEQKLLTRSAYFKTGMYKSLGKLQKAIRYREALRLERTRLFGMYRSLYLALGKKFCANKLLDDAQDVFYLTEKEIAALVQEPGERSKALVKERKAEFEAYKKEEVPSRVVVPSPPGEPADNREANPHGLQGTGCYPGTATAEAIVIMGPENDLNVNGKIVCALRTDPGWASLFPTCKGVLIEKGSALSHSVILLREFGIPTVINIPGLTKRITSGQRVAINGTTGEIHIATDEAD